MNINRRWTTLECKTLCFLDSTCYSSFSISLRKSWTQKYLSMFSKCTCTDLQINKTAKPCRSTLKLKTILQMCQKQNPKVKVFSSMINSISLVVRPRIQDLLRVPIIFNGVPHTPFKLTLVVLRLLRSEQSRKSIATTQIGNISK